MLLMCGPIRSGFVRAGAGQGSAAEGHCSEKPAADVEAYASRIEGDPGSKVNTGRVLATIDGDNITIGTPVVDGAAVELEIVRHARSPKIDVGRTNRSLEA